MAPSHSSPELSASSSLSSPLLAAAALMPDLSRLCTSPLPSAVESMFQRSTPSKTPTENSSSFLNDPNLTAVSPI